MNGCEHRWVLYAPAQRRWWQPARYWWKRRGWRLFCSRCGAGAGTWPTKAEALQEIAFLSDDWKN